MHTNKVNYKKKRKKVKCRGKTGRGEVASQVFGGAWLKEDLVKVTLKEYMFCITTVKLYFISRLGKRKYCVLLIRVSAATFYYPHTKAGCGNHKTFNRLLQQIK